MINAIAIFTDSIAVTVPIDNEGVFHIYKQVKGEWVVKESIPFKMMPEEGLGYVRNQFKTLAEKLECCDIIIASKILGLAYTILDPKGFELWEIEGPVKSFFDEVIAEVEEEVIEEDSTLLLPLKINDGDCYFIDLKEVMKKTGGRKSSKEILIPFLENHKFYELNVRCSHVPQWFEKTLSKLGLVVTVEENGQNEFEAIIRHRVCNE